MNLFIICRGWEGIRVGHLQGLLDATSDAQSDHTCYGFENRR